jgi:hypothetical protein
MHRLVAGLAIVVCVAQPGDLGAQVAIPEVRIGAPVTGHLPADSAQVTYRFTAAAGDRLGFAMKSDSFDTVLEVGRLRNDEWVSVGENDDADGTNSRLSLVIDSAGEYRILARAFEAGSEGPFTLEMTSESDPTCCAPKLSLAVDAPGVLTDDDRPTDAGGRFDPFLLRGLAGQEVAVTMRTTAFTPRLRIGRWVGGAFQEIAAGTAAGATSRAVVRFPAEGEYLVMATAADTSGRGLYRIAVDPVASH